MKKNYHALWVLILFCAGCAAAVAPVVETYQAISLGKGAKKAAESLQPIGFEEEQAIGGSLAIQVFNKFGGMYDNAPLQKYIATLGRAIADVSDRSDIDAVKKMESQTVGDGEVEQFLAGRKLGEYAE